MCRAGAPGVIHRVQSRLERVTLRLWPRRKARPTLYTLRHQMGAGLKASGASRAAIAYVMGHQSTQSVEVYGDRRSAKRSGGLAVEAGDREAQAFEGVKITQHPMNLKPVKHSRLRGGFLLLNRR